MLDFELFSEMVTRWKNGREEVDKFEEAMKPFFDRSPILTLGQDVRDALSELICVLCGLEKDSDLLEWWAFEDVDKILEVSGGKKYDVTTVEGLYQYILDGNEAAKK